MIRPLVVPAFAVLVVSAALAAQDAGSAAQEKAPAARAQSPAAAPQAPAASADAQAPPPSFPAQVEQVIVDMVVTDKKGEPVRGLKRGDMSVYEDGVQQTIVSFDAVELPDEPLPVAPPPPRVSVNTEAADARGRTFVIVFDDVHMTPWKASRSKAAVASFLEKGVREGDRVTLISTAGGLWWSERMESGRQKLIDLIKRLDGRYVPDTSPERMSDSEAMRIHLYRDPDTTARVMRRYQTYGVTQARQNDTIDSLRQGTLEDPFVTARAAEVYYQAMTRLRITLDVLERALNGLAEAKGRKSVILVSEGFIHDINLDEFKRVNEAARRANAAIYFVNSRGLEGMPLAMTAQFATAMPDQDVGLAFTDSLDAVAGAEDIADDSGGFTVRNTNDLSSGIQRIARETQAYYLLGYIPTNTVRDGKFRKIEVKLADGKGLKVRARKGYYAPSDTGKTAFESKKGVDPVIQAALDSPWSQDAIPLRMTDYVGEEKTLGKAQVMVATEVDVRSLGFEEQDGRYLDTLEFLLVVAHRESGEFFRYDQSVNMKLLPATRDRLRRLWFPIVRDFELRAGDYQAKIVVRDKRSGRVGTVMHEFEVPPLDKFRVSTPILSDTRLTGAAAEGNPAGRLAVIVRREFPEGSDLFCQIEVFGAKKDERSGMPRVVHGYTVRRPDGSIFTSIAPSVIRPTSLGSVSRLFGFSLGDAPPGDYEIVMNLRDELAGTSVVLHEPFKVVPPVPGAAGSPAAGK
jgi:VWFA-related protein